MNRAKLDSIKGEVLRSYRDTIKVDSTEIADNGDTISVKFRHYCSYDNKISIPQEYLDIYGISKFQTHDFISEVEFKINSRIIYKGVISKSDFSRTITGELKKYGVLYYSPDLSISGKQLSIDYNISMPLSGEGWGYTISIDSTGKKLTGALD
ncbi:hypothetical protein SNE26_29020 [Mucilaginibacter sp. cycad4]|uniref:hypothetical protein n=1 Tax=Mucilaginibacter sp. cycad4 TaxID=3342096 RepID=UPI002AAB48F6|nr:hypothetical protein [Mucilaginibacter gossypii]WPV00057.1 hypothetical protein SNE26_29020 [Mucilaginibacter gossypii]